MKVAYIPGPPVVARDDGLRLAGRWLSEEDPIGRKATIVVPVQRSPENAPLLGEIAARYSCESARTMQHAGRPLTIVLAVWPSRQTLERLESRRPQSICVLDWRKEETADWLAAHSAKDLSGRAAAHPPATVGDPVVRVALEELSQFVNLGTNLVQTEDHEHAVQTLRLLRDHGHALRPDELYRWAVACGWPGQGATNLVKLTEEILAGRRHRIGARPFGNDVYEAWKRAAVE